MKNAVYSGIGFVFPILIALFTTPYIVHKLGTELYGIYVLCISMIGFMSFFDLGFGTGIVKFVSQYEAKGDFDKINKIISTALIVNIFMGFFGVVCIFLFTDYLAVHLFKVKIENQYITEVAFKITAIGFLIVLLNGIFSNIPKALQKYDVATKIQTSIWVASTLSTVLILYFGFGLKEVLLLWVFFQVSGLFAYYASIKFLLPSLSINFNFNLVIFKEIFEFSMFAAMNGITGNIVFRVDKMIVGSILGTSFITYYQVSFMIVQMANGFIGSLLQFLFPSVSYIQSLGDEERLKNMYMTATKYATILALVIFTSLTLLGESFLTLWMGKDFAEKSINFIPILSFIYVFHSIASVGISFYNGLGYSKINMLSSFIGAVSYLITSFLLIKTFGLIGAAISFGFTLVSFPYFFYKLIKVLNISFKWLIKLLLKVSIIILFVWAIKYLVSFKTVNSYEFILYVLISSGFIICSAYMLKLFALADIKYFLKKLKMI